uniref:MFS multidrug transporter n=1 Tax=Colletotrichum fructicola (strain Nara gc5) TaxID=1213859 RepID=L2FND5_COLFN
MLVAFPYGILSDRIGRKAVLLLAYFGTVLTFSWAPLMLSFFPEANIYFLFVGMVFGVIGGGCTLSPPTSAPRRTAPPTSSTSLSAPCSAASSAPSTPAAGYLMEQYGPWLPIKLVFLFTPPIFLICALLPETLRVKAGDGPQTPQYVSKHFGWTLAQTSFLLSPLSFLHLGILFILPWLSKVLTNPRGRFRCSGFGKDALLAKGSYLMIALGGFIEGCSWEIVFVDQAHTSRLYALISMVDTLGSPLGGPALAWTFTVGLEKKGPWRGLPWFYVSLLAGLTWAALSLVTEPRKKGAIQLESHDEDVSGRNYDPEAVEGR